MDTIVVIINQFTKMIWLKTITMSISLEEKLPKSTETTFGNYIGYQGKFSVTKNYSLYQNLWKNS